MKARLGGQLIESGIPGLGKVPGDWSPTRMDKYINYIKPTVSSEELRGVEVFHYSIPVVQATGTGAVEDGSDIDSSKIRIQREVTLVSKLNPRKATVCRAAPHDQLITVCSGEFVPLAAKGIDLGFLTYVLLSTPYRERLESMVESATRSHQRVNPADIYKFWWAIPPLKEQSDIADFLDRETAKIDALITKQEQLIATLREDRTATITHAVTKGLSDGVELSNLDSELPEVPAHWTVKKLKKLGHLVTGGTPPTSESGYYADDQDGFPWFRPDDLDASGRPSVASRYLTEAGSSTVPHLTAPLVLVVSIGATLAKVGYADVACSCNQQINAVVGADNPKFMFYAITAAYDRIWAASMGNTLPIISAGRLAQVKIATPPTTEQEILVTYLDGVCAKIDALVAKAEQVIETLREYRSALITDAVTGKIDVRGAA